MADEEASEYLRRVICTEILEPDEWFKHMRFFSASQAAYPAEAIGQRPYPVSLHLFCDLKARSY